MYRFPPSRHIDQCQRTMERLERRDLLHSTGLGDDAAFLTLSFVPDGTSVAGHPSALFETLDSLGPRQAWQETILSAFQVWTAETNADVGLVDDGGEPLGTSGPARRDRRFGDVRVAAAPLSPDVLAISIPENSLLTGSWVGDVIFNSDGGIDNLDTLFSVALHEAGHVFGLEHNPDPRSPMHAHGGSHSTLPAASDLDDLFEVYGVRNPDVNERAQSNDRPSDATQLWPAETESRLPGSAPSVAFGDLTTSSDVDYYAMNLPQDYVGPLTFTLRTRGLSALQSEFALLDRAGRPLQVAQLETPAQPEDLILQWDRNLGDDNLVLLRVRAVDQASYFATGNYALTVTFDDRLEVANYEIERMTGGEYRTVSHDAMNALYRDGIDPLRNYDHHTNDTWDEAQRLTTSVGFDLGARYEHYGVVSNASDTDMYRVRAPATGAGTILVAVRSRQTGQLIPQVGVFDEQQQIVPTRVLINGLGQLVVQSNHFVPNHDYFVVVRSSEHVQPSTTGTYQLTVDFGSSPIELGQVAEGHLSSANPRDAQFLYVAQPQLLHLVLETERSDSDSFVTAALSNSDFHITAAAGDTRTSVSVLLLPGTYTFDFQIKSVSEPIGDIRYRLWARAASTPFGVIPIDPLGEPAFRCADLTDQFCFPNGLVTPTVFTFEEFEPLQPVDPFDLRKEDALNSWWNLESRATPAEPPATERDVYRTLGGDALLVPASTGVLSNDDGQDLLAATLDHAPEHGSLILQSHGGFDYRPDQGFEGTDTFRYRAIDAAGASSLETVTIQVLARPRRLAGDANRDGRFDSSDIVLVMQAGEYRDSLAGNSVWETGDWTGDGEFNTADWVVAFQAGNYEP